MNTPQLTPAYPAPGTPLRTVSSGTLVLPILVFGIFACAAAPARSQAITIDKQGNVTNSGAGNYVDRRYAQIEPTHVVLSQSPLDAKNRQELIRLMQSEQGFAMRPFPRGHKGLSLTANGKLSPAGEKYLDMVTAQGISAKPGDRLVITNLKIEHNHIVFDLNGGPDVKHRFLSHVQIGVGPNLNPVVQNGDGQEPMGSRLTLEFKDRVPELTGSQLKALLAPLISFDVKTPIEAFTDTLPPALKDAILKHHVMVGMSTDMVLFAKGQPLSKSREMDGQMPFEEWIYGQPPQPVEFVRINGNRVIRVEVAKVGEKPVIYTENQVEGLMRTDGTPLEASRAHTVQIGDVQRNPDTQSPDAPPTLRNPGEAAPDNGNGTNGRLGEMRPVQFPRQKPDDYPDASNLPRVPQKDSDEDDSSATAPKPAPASSAPAAPASAAPSATAPSSPVTAPQPASSTVPPAPPHP